MSYKDEDYETLYQQFPKGFSRPRTPPASTGPVGSRWVWVPAKFVQLSEPEAQKRRDELVGREGEHHGLEAMEKLIGPELAGKYFEHILFNLNQKETSKGHWERR